MQNKGILTLEIEKKYLEFMYPRVTFEFLTFVSVTFFHFRFSIVITPIENQKSFIQTFFLVHNDKSFTEKADTPATE